MLNDPTQAYLEMARMKERNRQQALQDAMGIGQNLSQGASSIIQQIAQAKAKKQLQEALGQPDQIPMMKYAPPGVTPQNPNAPQMQANPNAPTLSSLSGPLQTLYPQEFGKLMSDRFDPLKQAEIQQKLASANHLNNLGQGGAGSTTSVWRNKTTGEVTDVQPEDTAGYVEYKVKPGQALQTVVNTPFQKEKADAQRDKTATWRKMIDNRQINEIVKRTGLTQKQQSALQANNLRGYRAIEILSRPITWQELALGEIDLAGIMQGGVPHVDEVKSIHFPGWQEQIAKWKTYATGHPTESVPEPIRKKVLDLINGVVTIDNKFLEANAKFIKNTLGKTIKGSSVDMNTPIDEMTKALQSAPASPSGTNSGWSYVGAK